MPSYIEKMASAFEDELEKIRMHKQAGVAGVAAPMVAGGALALWAQKANKDRQMGRAMRIQSGQSY